MAKPVLVIVDDEDASRHALARELESRYGAHYQIVAGPSPEIVLSWLTGFRDEGVAVPLVLADHWMPGMTGTEFLARVKDIVPTARRGLVISWGDPSTTEPILKASALGQMEFYVPKPVWSPDEQFHRAITEALDEWWREQGGRFEAVTVIGEEPSVRTHEIRDTITRDQWGFILTGPDAAPRWPLARAPFPFETTAPGVFAVGDVRHGSVKRVASAVGEGSIAVRLVHDYLALALQAT